MIREFYFDYDFKENESYSLEANFDLMTDLNLPLDVEADLSIQNNIIVDFDDLEISQDCCRD